MKDELFPCEMHILLLSMAFLQERMAGKQAVVFDDGTAYAIRPVDHEAFDSALSKLVGNGGRIIPPESLTTPTHRSLLSLPGDRLRRVSSEVVPVRKLKISAACKYCTDTGRHRDWWEMNPDDYGGVKVILCGKCEHASPREDS